MYVFPNLDIHQQKHISCLRVRFLHLARTVPPLYIQDMASQFDVLIFNTFKAIFHLPNSLPDLVDAQIRLPTRVGGM